MLENKKILIMASHTDDGELGCGGTIKKMTRADIRYYNKTKWKSCC